MKNQICAVLLSIYGFRVYLNENKTIFQHDSAPPHFSQDVQNLLNEQHEIWIGRDGPINWPPRFPDLTFLDFYLWGHVKSKVYEKKITSFPQLKASIVSVFEEL